MATVTDLFCGAGGSSTGAVAAGGEVVFAANHWQLAIETHNTNHPTTEHDLADLRVTHPSRYQGIQSKLGERMSYRNGAFRARIKASKGVVTPAMLLTSGRVSYLKAIAMCDSIISKPCTKCGVEKPASAFHKHKLGKYGLNPVCKECRSRAIPKPPISEGMRRCTKCSREFLPTAEYYPVDTARRDGFRPECLICYRTRQQEYRDSHRDELNAKSRTRYAANPELRLSINRQSVARNPQRARMVKQLSAQRKPRNKTKERIKRMRRYSLKNQLPTTLIAQDWLFALDYFNYRCAVCGKPAGFWHVIAADHWIPITSKRPDNPGTVPVNIIPLCHSRKGMPVGEPSCNQSKSNKEPLDWLVERYGRAKANEIHTRIETFFEVVGKGNSQ